MLESADECRKMLHTSLSGGIPDNKSQSCWKIQTHGNHEDRGCIDDQRNQNKICSSNIFSNKKQTDLCLPTHAYRWRCEMNTLTRSYTADFCIMRECGMNCRRNACQRSGEHTWDQWGWSMKWDTWILTEEVRPHFSNAQVLVQAGRAPIVKKHCVFRMKYLISFFVTSSDQHFRVVIWQHLHISTCNV